ncbi:MAG: branched-chain amino acid aminotransferase, partial [Candidatus Dormibacteraeota bacterium]|nr:branched-chain amino acid aminotransferase [Candidatus Dormibacteraeota bacterium]
MQAEKRERLLADPGFGRIFTEHMVRISWNRERGWHDGELRPYGPLQLDPGVSVLHYAQAVFEGLKAFRQRDGGIAVFRPDAHAERFRRSARRLALPELPEGVFIEAIERLLSIDAAWVPSAAEHSLYLRPFMFASEVGLGVHPSTDVTFLLIGSPSGSYFPSGVKPVTVWLSEDFSRAAPGGTGEAKTGGNYAGGLLAQAQAAEQGCDQVVWLDSHEHRWVEEMGGMNLYFVYGSGPGARVVTPSLTGTLLPG